MSIYTSDHAHTIATACVLCKPVTGMGCDRDGVYHFGRFPIVRVTPISTAATKDRALTATPLTASKADVIILRHAPR